MILIISLEIMNIWFQNVVNYHGSPHVARIALKVIVTKVILNRIIPASISWFNFIAVSIKLVFWLTGQLRQIVFRSNPSQVYCYLLKISQFLFTNFVQL